SARCEPMNPATPVTSALKSRPASRRDPIETPYDAPVRPTAEDTRSLERVRAQYEVERELADRLLRASEDERPGLYASVYRELFRRVPDHPQLTRPLAPDYLAERVRAKVH